MRSRTSTPSAGCVRLWGCVWWCRPCKEEKKHIEPGSLDRVKTMCERERIDKLSVIAYSHI